MQSRKANKKKQALQPALTHLITISLLFLAKISSKDTGS